MIHFPTNIVWYVINFANNIAVLTDDPTAIILPNSHYGTQGKYIQCSPWLVWLSRLSAGL